ncbi:ArgS-related anticodon-binding protein NrtL [Streptomyces sp. NPDC101132]|uniref:ArgS-related anticodon-binding protein NrtL n=1 Tax=Streptomyces sp. NPDC101132 TaxID=3366110 RepID=UPI00380B08AA
MTPADLSRTVARAVRSAVARGELCGVTVPDRVVVERTRPGGVGEYATPVAFRVGKGAEGGPRRVAEVLAGSLSREPEIRSVVVTGGGFLNFELLPASAGELVREVAEKGAAYGFAPAPLPVEPVEPVQPVGPVDADADADTDTGTPTDLRRRVVREVVVRLLRARGIADPYDGLDVAPLARRDADAGARYGDQAARWAMLSVPPAEAPAFPATLLAQTEGNPFFLVRYAHSRARALLRNAAQLGFAPEAGATPDHHPVLRALAEYPLVLEAAAHHRAPDRLARHLVTLGDALLDLQHTVLPLGDEKPSAAHRSRLALVEAAGTVLAGGLSLLGIDAPETS